MVKIVEATLIIILILLIKGCVTDKSDQKFSFPGNEIAPTPEADNSNEGGDQGEISILSTKTFNLTSSTTYPGNIAYDGTRLLFWIPAGQVVCAPDNQASFQYLTLDFTLQATSTSTYIGISSNGSCNGNSYQTFGTTIGSSGLLWKKTSSIFALSLRDNTNGNVLSTIDINPSDYGCDTNDYFKVTYCGGLFYGACLTTDWYKMIRFFSFNSSGSMQSAVTTNLDERTYQGVRGIACYGNSLIVVTGRSEKNVYNRFYKYDLNFNQIAVDSSTSYELPSQLHSIFGIATDGTYLYLQGSSLTNSSPATMTFGKATLGDLQ